MRKETCDQLINEAEQSCQKMGWDFYEIMKRAPAVVERWKRYAPLVQGFWSHATDRQQLTEFMIPEPDLSPEAVETMLTLIRTLPHLLRGYFQDAAASLPPSPGGRPRELTPEQRKEVCLRIGQLYGQGVEVRDAQERMAKHYNVSLRTIQRAWQQRAKWNRFK